MNAAPAHLQRFLATKQPGFGLQKLGVPAIDSALAGGLALGRLHEIAGDPRGTLPAAFAAVVLAGIGGDAPVLWACRPDDAVAPLVYAPGLLGFGLDPGRVVMAALRSDAETCQVMEVALREGGLAAVVGEVGVLPRLPARRLHLACLRHGITAFVLRRGDPAARRMVGRIGAGDSTAAATRWRIAPAPHRHWQLDLLHARGGREGSWLVTLEPRHDLSPPALRLVADTDIHAGAGSHPGSAARHSA